MLREGPTRLCARRCIRLGAACSGALLRLARRVQVGHLHELAPAKCLVLRLALALNLSTQRLLRTRHGRQRCAARRVAYGAWRGRRRTMAGSAAASERGVRSSSCDAELRSHGLVCCWWLAAHSHVREERASSAAQEEPPGLCSPSAPPWPALSSGEARDGAAHQLRRPPLAVPRGRQEPGTPPLTPSLRRRC